MTLFCHCWIEPIGLIILSCRNSRELAKVKIISVQGKTGQGSQLNARSAGLGQLRVRQLVLSLKLQSKIEPVAVVPWVKNEVLIQTVLHPWQGWWALDHWWLTRWLLGGLGLGTCVVWDGYYWFPLIWELYDHTFWNPCMDVWQG